MRLEKRKSGLVIPVQPPEPKRPFCEPRQPLELDDDEGRDIVYRAFDTLLNLPAISGHGLLVKSELTSQARFDIVLAAGKQLLGTDWEPELLC